MIYIKNALLVFTSFSTNGSFSSLTFYSKTIINHSFHCSNLDQLSELSTMSKKVVLKLQIHDDKEKQQAMKAVSSLAGIESLAIDMKEKKLTVIGDVDPVQLVSKLRKQSWHTDILTVGPAKEEKKKEDEKKKEEKKDDSAKKEDNNKNKKPENEQFAEYLKFHNTYNPPPNYYPQPQYYSAEENPNSCVIF